MKNYSKLKKMYPEYISLEQFYKICKIAKRSAAYLLQNKIVPCIDTGKGTWRYKIKIDDVIEYLKKKDKNGNMVPYGAVTQHRKNKIENTISFPYILEDNMDKFIKFLNNKFYEYEDALTVDAAARITGNCCESIRRRINHKEIDAVLVNQCFYIAKDDLFDYMITKEYLKENCNLPHLKGLLSEFEVWIGKK